MNFKLKVVINFKHKVVDSILFQSWEKFCSFELQRMSTNSREIITKLGNLMNH